MKFDLLTFLAVFVAAAGGWPVIGYALAQLDEKRDLTFRQQLVALVIAVVLFGAIVGTVAGLVGAR